MKITWIVLHCNVLHKMYRHLHYILQMSFVIAIFYESGEKQYL